MKSHQRTEGINDEWLTPPEILTALGTFDLDPCSPAARPWPTARKHISLPNDGLNAQWHGRIWCNPPFNRYARPKWMEKMSKHGNGIMLIPEATETEAFDAYVWRKAAAVCFVKKRPHFYFIDGTRARANCGCSIALVAYGRDNASTLQAANLGQTLKLNPASEPRLKAVGSDGLFDGPAKDSRK